MKGWRLLLFGILIGLISGGAIFLVSRPVRGVPITLQPPPTRTPTSYPIPTATDTPIEVQIGGEILNPGVYSLPKGSRLGDLITLAGGMSRLSDEKRVNLAAQLIDGDYFYIPSEGENIPESAANAPNGESISSSQLFEYPIDLNQANQEALESLPGIGPTKASDILAYRNQHGPFSDVDELLNVPGIGPSTLENIRDFLVIMP
jgi:competence protein ComEA